MHFDNVLDFLHSETIPHVHLSTSSVLKKNQIVCILQNMYTISEAIKVVDTEFAP